MFVIIYFYSFFGRENRVVTLKLIRYSMLLVLVPLGTFYIMFYVVCNKDKDLLGWCGIAAVIATNLVLLSYVVMAWNEKREPAIDRTTKMT